MCPLFLSEFNKTWIFSTVFLNIQISNLIKIRLVGAELFHADGRTDGRTDTTKLTDAFRNFAKAPNKKHKEFLKGSSNTYKI